VAIVELIMLTPLSTITAGLPRSTPAVKRLPLMTQVCGERVGATRMSASWPKADTMPMRGVHSVRRTGLATGPAADAQDRPSASADARNRFFKKLSRE
jgi:hypothetical protein